MPKSAWTTRYFSGLLAYQYEQLKHQTLAPEAAAQGSFSAPAFQVAPAARIQLAQYIAALEPFAGLKDGWDDAHSHAPSVVGLWQAVVGGLFLVAVGLPAPTPKVLTDGTMGVFWRHGRGYAAIDFEDDGIHVWTVSDGKTYKSGTWDSSAEMPQPLKNAASGPGIENTPATLQATLP